MAGTSRNGGGGCGDAAAVGQGMKRRAEEMLSPSINIKVKSQDGREFFFKIRRDTRLQKLLHAYCKKAQVDYQTIRFYYEGETFPVRKTPDELLMGEGDEIEAMVHCGGGGNAGV